MEIRLYATLRPIVGKSTVTLDAQPGDTVQSMLDELITRHPALREKLFRGRTPSQHSRLPQRARHPLPRRAGDAHPRADGDLHLPASRRRPVSRHDYYGVPL
ncbi:MAG: hypothetical protein R2873_24690 [Caldilineaceae bacterium]